MSKQINIQDKYFIQKVSGKNQKRETIKKWDKSFQNDNISIDKEKNELVKLYSNIDTSMNKIMREEIQKKRNSYKQQDIKKKRNIDFFVSLNECFELLLESKLKCSYCKKWVVILYQNIREKKQWTLDRVDNDKCHSKDNCVVSCLSCNISKKRLNDNKFRFTKQMILVKKED